MDQGITFLAIIHIFVALLLVTFVLLQDSKGGGMGGAFGGGSSQTIFGATGAVNFLVKVTRVLAVVFMLTCIVLTLLMSRRSGHSVTDKLGTLRRPATPEFEHRPGGSQTSRGRRPSPAPVPENHADSLCRSYGGLLLRTK